VGTVFVIFLYCRYYYRESCR